MAHCLLSQQIAVPTFRAARRSGEPSIPTLNVCSACWLSYAFFASGKCLPISQLLVSLISAACYHAPKEQHALTPLSKAIRPHILVHALATLHSLKVQMCQKAVSSTSLTSSGSSTSTRHAYLMAIAATRDESRPPESNTPRGASDISRLTTDLMSSSCTACNCLSFGKTYQSLHSNSRHITTIMGYPGSYDGQKCCAAFVSLALPQSLTADQPSILPAQAPAGPVLLTSCRQTYAMPGECQPEAHHTQAAMVLKCVLTLMAP